jgi:Methyltransferase domain
MVKSKFFGQFATNSDDKQRRFMTSKIFLKLTHQIRILLARAAIKLLSVSGLYQGYWNYWRIPEIFDFAEAQGFHILPVHYYTPIPTADDLKRERRQNSMAGIELNLEGGVNAACSLIAKYKPGIEKMLEGTSGFDVKNNGFDPIDAAILYSVIRETRPRRIIEIGSGMSTIVMITAIRDQGLDTKLICIEPYLPDYLKSRRNEISEIIEAPLQSVPPSTFDDLDAGDILFIDSTHVVRFDSDVVYEFLEILPRLRPNVNLHVHDIFLPNDYPQQWLAHRFFWSEQYILQAFLSMNPSFKIEMPLHAARPEILARFPNLPVTSTETASLWIKRMDSK